MLRNAEGAGLVFSRGQLQQRKKRRDYVYFVRVVGVAAHHLFSLCWQEHPLFAWMEMHSTTFSPGASARADVSPQLQNKILVCDQAKAITGLPCPRPQVQILATVPNDTNQSHEFGRFHLSH